MRRPAFPTVPELREWLADQRRLRELIDYAEAVDERRVKLTLYHLMELPISIDRAAEIRRIILISALSTRLLFRVLALSRDLDLLI